ncbi:MAG: endonuclease/exonuclease/phosphatase family protein [Capsulimonadales bacterium]|nr:endonuclease/exonuclease/phosphatase family protein [Capsulimonadales bacterium]
MSFNLRFASPDPPNAWPDRLPVMTALLRREMPDLIGTQEGYFSQLRDLEAGLPEYRWIGTGRDGGSRGEFMAIFYRPERFEPQEFDHFWLSDTPETVGSATWGNSNRRMVTWVRFRLRGTDTEFVFANTHFDFADPFHTNAGNLVLSRLRVFPPELPVLLVGDFNAAAEAPGLYSLLTGEEAFRDAYREASVREGPQGIATAHGYRSPHPGNRIDWILLRGPVTARSAAILTDCGEDGQYPSDHFPVTARLDLSASA